MNTFSLQTRLYSGPGSLKVLSRFSHKHIWIICDVFLARSPLIDCIDSLEVRKKPGGHWIIRDLAGLDLVGLASQ